MLSSLPIADQWVQVYVFVETLNLGHSGDWYERAGEATLYAWESPLPWKTDNLSCKGEAEKNTKPTAGWYLAPAAGNFWHEGPSKQDRAWSCADTCKEQGLRCTANSRKKQSALNSHNAMNAVVQELGPGITGVTSKKGCDSGGGRSYPGAPGLVASSSYVGDPNPYYNPSCYWFDSRGNNFDMQRQTESSCSAQNSNARTQPICWCEK